MRVIACIFIFLALSLTTKAQSSFRDDPIAINDSGYFVSKSSAGYKVNVSLILSNPFENRFASRPSVQVTVRGTDGAIIASKELKGAGVPPKGTIAICEIFSIDEKPAKLDFQPLSAWYEATDLKPSDFKPFTLENIRAKPTGNGYIRVTGEIRNPFSKQTGVWVCFLFRDKQDKLVGGYKLYKSEIPAGNPIAFEVDIPDDELPGNLGSIEKLVFCHNNYLSSWREILR
jgi:hypothetical protein